MARFVMSNRRSGKFRESDKTTARAAVGVAMSRLSAGIQIQSDREPSEPTARRTVIFEAEPAEIESVRASLSDDVIIEPEILHWPSPITPLQFLRMNNSPAVTPLAAGTGSSLKVTVTGAGVALANAEVHLTLRALGQPTELRGTTNGSGKVTFNFSAFWTPSALLVSPAGDFWTMVVLGPSGTATVDCPALPQDGPLGWWHGAFGITQYKATRGKGIRVGVADTGLGPHPNLAHAQSIGAFIGGQHQPAAGADADSHGSHVCGIIGAKPAAQSGQYAGIAPGAELFSARVFPPNEGANQVDIANAIEALSKDHAVDLINLSLGSKTPSEVERDAIQDASERGTLCICAAANSGGPVEFPAAFDESVAVSALGQMGWGPAGSLASMRLPQDPERLGSDNLYLANFSCFGAELEACGPGVGYLSTVPVRHGLPTPYGSMDGTSMASPAVCGALAAILASSAAYQQLPRDQTRSQFARNALQDACQTIGLAAKYQGAGLPKV